MSIITLMLASLVALEHLYIMYLETFATQSDATSRIFKISKEELHHPTVNKLFKNQGIYNGLIAIFLLYGIVINNVTILSIFLLNVVLVACYGAFSVDKKIILTQGSLAILALITLWF